MDANPAPHDPPPEDPPPHDPPPRRRPRRRRLRRIGVGVLVLLAGWLVLDKTMSILAPEPDVGHWRSGQARQAYAEAYDQVMATLPEPTRVQDVPTGYGTVRVLTWEGTEPGPPVLLLPGHSSGAPMWAENLPDWIGHRTIHALDPVGDAGFSAQSVPLTRFEDQAEWISQTLTALGVDRAHVTGHSFGGANAAVLAVRHPEQVATLTVLEPVIVVHRLPASAFFWATLTQLPVPQGWKDRALAEIGGTTVEEVRRRSPMAVMIDAAAQGYAAAVPLPRTLTDEEWAALPMPVRADIAGTMSLAGGMDAADRLRGLLPQAQVQVWPQATHSLPMQEKTTLDGQLLQFWRAHS